MPPKYEQLMGENFWVGVDEVTDPASLQQGFYSFGRNVRCVNGKVTTRGGHLRTVWTNATTDGNTPVALGTTYGAVNYVTPDGQRFAIVFGANNAWRLSSTAHRQTIAYPAGVTISRRVQAVQCGGEIRVARGSDNIPLVWRGTGNFELVDQSDAITGYRRMPNADFILYYYNRLFVLSGDSVWASETGDFDLYDLTKEYPVDDGSNDKSTGIYVYNQDTILVTKTSSVYTLTALNDTLSDVLTQQIAGEVGTQAPLGPIVDNGEIYLPTTYGIFPVSTAFETRLKASALSLSKNISNTYGQINFPSFDGVVGAVGGDYYYWAVPQSGSTTNNRVLVYSIETRQWVGFDDNGPGYHVADWVRMELAGKLELCAITPDGYCYLYAIDDMLAEVTDWAAGDNLTTSYWVSRGYTPGPGSDLRYSEIELNIQTINPKYSIYTITDGVSERATATTTDQTRSNVKYTTYNTPDWDSTNINLDFYNPYREDYTITANNTGFVLDLLSGGSSSILTNLKQDFRHRVRTVQRGRYLQVAIENKRGALDLIGISLTGLSAGFSYQSKQTT